MSQAHTLILPIVLPLMTGAWLVLIERRCPRLAPWLAGTSVLAGLLVAMLLLNQARGNEVQAYLLGNWAAPFGIALALDRLSAMMVLLTSLLGCATLLYASAGDAGRGRHFYSLFQFQLMGLNGAFLTADLFNLFVFFEVLLIASYGLVLHGAGVARLRAAVHYVSFNLAGSALFLVAASLLYGLTGTLNMADLAQRVEALGADRNPLLQSAGLLLIVVFSVKAALLPLYFWLPATYGAASAPVAALFAIMTKVGIYAILRVNTLIFGDAAGTVAWVTSPWLEVIALGTLLLGAVGALAATNLRMLIGHTVIASAGTLLLAGGLARPDAVAAGLFYLVDSTLVVAALFLLADRLRHDRGSRGDDFQPAGTATAGLGLGLVFLILAVASAGVPPLAGFLGKAMLLQAAGQVQFGGAVVATILFSSFLMMVAFARSGSMLFWTSAATQTPEPDPGHRPGATKTLPGAAATRWQHQASLAFLLGLIAACSVLAGPLSRYTEAAAKQLFERTAYIDAVLKTQPVPAAIDVRREMRERKVKGEQGS